MAHPERNTSLGGTYVRSRFIVDPKGVVIPTFRRCAAGPSDRKLGPDVARRPRPDEGAGA